MEHFHHRHQPTNRTTSPRATVRSGVTPSPKGKGKKQRGNQGQAMILYRHIGKLDKVSRVFRINGVVSSNAGGGINLFTVTSIGVTSSPDWANFSQEFANYRVKAMKFRLFPATTSATSTTGPFQSVLQMNRWWGLAPSTESQISQDEEIKYYSTLERGEITTNYLGYLDAQQWTPVGTAISAERAYGFAGVSPSGTASNAVSSTIFSYCTERLVEFIDTY